MNQESFEQELKTRQGDQDFINAQRRAASKFFQVRLM